MDSMDALIKQYIVLDFVVAVGHKPFAFYSNNIYMRLTMSRVNGIRIPLVMAAAISTYSIRFSMSEMEDFLINEAKENYDLMLLGLEKITNNTMETTTGTVNMLLDVVETTTNDGTSNDTTSGGADGGAAFYGMVFFILLAIQCGAHPVLIKLYMPSTVVRSTVVFSQEIIKLVISIFFLITSGTFGDVFESWNIRHTIVAAGIPSAMFVVQNYCNLMSNQTLPPVTFVLLNQTKIISTAWCCFMFLGQMQTELQLVALFLLFLSTLLLQKIIPLRGIIRRCYMMTHNTNNNSNKNIHDIDTKPLIPQKKDDDSYSSIDDDDDIDIERQQQQQQQQQQLHQEAGESSIEVKIILENEQRKTSSNQKIISNDDDDDDGVMICEDVSTTSGLGGKQVLMMGVVPALVASFLSGLAGTLSQKTLQTDARDPYLFNVELSIFSCTFLLLSLMAPTVSSSDGFRMGSPDFHRIRKEGLTVGWTWQTCIPILVNALGAILVGLVTKYSGAVIKGFANIFGILISAMLNQIFLRDSQGRGGLSLEEVVGGTIGIISLWMHLTNSSGSV